MDWPLSCVQMIFITVPCMRLSCCLVALGGGRTVHPNLGWKELAFRNCHWQLPYLLPPSPVCLPLRHRVEMARDVEKIQLSQRVTIDRREGAKVAVRGSVRGEWK